MSGNGSLLGEGHVVRARMSTFDLSFLCASCPPAVHTNRTHNLLSLCLKMACVELKRRAAVTAV